MYEGRQLVRQARAARRDRPWLASTFYRRNPPCSDVGGSQWRYRRWCAVGLFALCTGCGHQQPPVATTGAAEAGPAGARDRSPGARPEERNHLLEAKWSEVVVKAQKQGKDVFAAVKLVAPKIRIFHAAPPPGTGDDKAPKKTSKPDHTAPAEVIISPRSCADYAAGRRPHRHPRRTGRFRRRQPIGASRALAARSRAFGREPDHADYIWLTAGRCFSPPARRWRTAGSCRSHHRPAVRDRVDLLRSRGGRGPSNQGALSFHRARDHLHTPEGTISISSAPFSSIAAWRTDRRVSQVLQRTSKSARRSATLWIPSRRGQRTWR